MKRLVWMWVLFTVIGVAALGGGGYWLVHTRTFIASASIAEGEVLELIASRSDDSYTYRPRVRFTTADGQTIEFVASSGSNPPAYDVGERVRVYYDAQTPQRAMVDGFFSLWGGPAIFGGIGLVFTLIGGGALVHGRLTARRNAELKARGIPLQTQFQQVVRNTSLKVNGRSPYRIVSQWLDPVNRKLFIFESDNLWYDPTALIEAKTITVYVRPGDYSVYWMDTGFLPERGN